MLVTCAIICHHSCVGDTQLCSTLLLTRGSGAISRQGDKGEMGRWGHRDTSRCQGSPLPLCAFQIVCIIMYIISPHYCLKQRVIFSHGLAWAQHNLTVRMWNMSHVEHRKNFNRFIKAKTDNSSSGWQQALQRTCFSFFCFVKTYSKFQPTRSLTCYITYIHLKMMRWWWEWKADFWFNLIYNK